MGLMKDISGMVKTYFSLVTFAVIAVADYIWEDKYFTCPCVDKSMRIIYSVAFLLSPAIFLLLADSNCRVLSITCKNCCSEKFCRRRSGITRPCILAGAWIIYSVMDPRFSECIVSGRFSKDKPKNCTDEDHLVGELKSYLAIAILSLSISVLILIVVVSCCCQGSCRNCCKKCLNCFFCNRKAANCCNCCEEVNIERLSAEQSLTGQTLVILEEEDLLKDCLVGQLDDSDFKVLESKLTRGQMKIIKRIKSQMPQDSGEGNAAGAATSGDQSSGCSCWPGFCDKNNDSSLNPAAGHQTGQKSVRESNEGPGASPSINDASNDCNRQAQQQSVEENNGEPGTSASDDFDTSVKTPFPQRLGLNPADEQQAEQQSERESSEGPDTSPSTNDASNDFDRQAQQQNVEESNGEPGTSASDDCDPSVKSQRLGVKIKQSKKEEEMPLLSLPSTKYSNL